MSATDEVLRALGEHALEAGHKMFDNLAQQETLAATGLTYEEWYRGLVELRSQALVQMRDYDGNVALLALTQVGVWAYATRFRPELADLTERLLDTLDGTEANVALALGAELGESPLLVEAVLDHLAGRRMVVYSRVGRDSFRIHRFSI
ncbi:MAG TPA: hypothetical protein VHF27_05730 [Acidimicrobiales bacterium]|nr:hypothetical protein [Acidimicrobiales bacterium]